MRKTGYKKNIIELKNKITLMAQTISLKRLKANNTRLVYIRVLVKAHSIRKSYLDDYPLMYMLILIGEIKEVLVFPCITGMGLNEHASTIHNNQCIKL